MSGLDWRLYCLLPTSTTCLVAVSVPLSVFSNNPVPSILQDRVGTVAACTCPCSMPCTPPQGKAVELLTHLHLHYCMPFCTFFLLDGQFGEKTGRQTAWCVCSVLCACLYTCGAPSFSLPPFASPSFSLPYLPKCLLLSLLSPCPGRHGGHGMVGFLDLWISSQVVNTHACLPASTCGLWRWMEGVGAWGNFYYSWQHGPAWTACVWHDSTLSMGKGSGKRHGEASMPAPGQGWARKNFEKLGTTTIGCCHTHTHTHLAACHAWASELDSAFACLEKEQGEAAFPPSLPLSHPSFLLVSSLHLSLHFLHMKTKDFYNFPVSCTAGQAAGTRDGKKTWERRGQGGGLLRPSLPCLPQTCTFSSCFGFWDWFQMPPATALNSNCFSPPLSCALVSLFYLLYIISLLKPIPTLHGTYTYHLHISTLWLCPLPFILPSCICVCAFIVWPHGALLCVDLPCPLPCPLCSTPACWCLSLPTALGGGGTYSAHSLIHLI